MSSIHFWLVRLKNCNLFICNWQLSGLDWQLVMEKVKGDWITLIGLFGATAVSALCDTYFFISQSLAICVHWKTAEWVDDEVFGKDRGQGKAVSCTWCVDQSCWEGWVFWHYTPWPCLFFKTGWAGLWARRRIWWWWLKDCHDMWLDWERQAVSVWGLVFWHGLRQLFSENSSLPN